MRGDFSRLTFDPSRHYAGVLHQQGRVWLDADWNEDVQSRLHLLRQETFDIVGACGVPEPGSAFRISPNPNPARQADFLIGGGAGPRGRAYVDGILCRLDREDASYLRQPDLLDPPPIALPGAGGLLEGVVYLEVWERLITYLEDGHLREIALGGPDTATRIKTVAQVKFVAVPPAASPPASPPLSPPAGLTCATAGQFLPGPGRGTLTTLQPVDTPLDDPCRIPDPSTYTGRENHLYRVEIHNGGDVLGGAGAALRRDLAADALQGATALTLAGAVLTAAQLDALTRSGVVTLLDDDGRTETVALASASGTTLTLAVPLATSYTTAKHAAMIGGAARFKWSRDNAAFAVSVTAVSGDRRTLTLSALGRDQATALRAGDLVEIADDASDLGPARGHLTYLTADPDPDLFTVRIAEPLPAEFRGSAGTAAVLSPPASPPASPPMSPPASPPAAAAEDRHLTLRRWDGAGRAQAAFGETSTPDMNLGDGVHIQFGGTDLRAGDYWQFAARSADGSIEQLTDASPHGIIRHICPLAIVRWSTETWHSFTTVGQALTTAGFTGALRQRVDAELQALISGGHTALPVARVEQIALAAGATPAQVQSLRTALAAAGSGLGAFPALIVREDCREPFSPLTEPDFFHVSGDGQEALPGQALPRPVQVGVSRGRFLVAGARVRFEITGGTGTLIAAAGATGASLVVPTGPDGVAECGWQLDATTQSQQVQASLVDSTHVPIRFNANLSLAAQVAYDPSACSNLAGVTTVQEAIDRLCRLDRGGGCEVTVGEGGQFRTIEEAVRALQESREQDWCICLLGGEHELREETLIASPGESPSLHVNIHGCTPGTLLVLRNRLFVRRLASFTLTGLTIQASEVPDEAIIAFSICRAVTMRDLTFFLDGLRGPSALRFRECGDVTIEDTRFDATGNREPAVLRYEAVESAALRRVTIEARGVSRLVGCDKTDDGEVALVECRLTGVEEAPLLVEIGAGARRILLDNNVMAAPPAGRSGSPERVFVEFPELARLFAIAGRDQFLRESRGVAAAIARLTPEERRNTAERIKSRFADVANALPEPERRGYEALINALPGQNVTEGDVLTRLAGIRNAVQDNPGVAVVIADGHANVTLDGNIIDGIVCLYGPPGGTVLLDQALKRFASLLRDRVITFNPDDGMLQARGNRLTRLIAGEAMVRRINELGGNGGTLDGSFRSMLVGDNVFDFRENIFVAEHLALSSAMFHNLVPAAFRAGEAVALEATYVGNHAPAPDLGELLSVSLRHEQAANLMRISHQ